MNATLRIILATTSEYDAQVIDAAHGEALKLDLERDMDMDPLGHPKGFLKRDQWDPITRKPKVPAGTGPDQFFRCTATADALLKDGRAGIDALTDAADAATIHCQEFHELAMDYRGAPIGCGQAEYERLVAYINSYAASKA